MSDSSDSKSYKSKLIPYNSSLGKLLKDRFLCDVVIRVNTTTVPVHRVILSAASCFFYDLFKHFETKQEHDLTNVFIDSDNLNQILIYIYEGYVKIGWWNIFTLLTMNQVLGISSLNHHCAQFLLSELRPVNAIEIWQIAWKYNLQELANISLIVCRETTTYALMIKENIILLCEEFLSYLLANEEVMTTLSPKSVVRILAWWTCSRTFKNDEKINKLISLIDIYLSWKTLSVAEIKALRGDIFMCFDFDPPVPIHRLKFWSRKYKKTPSLATIDENKEINTLHIQGWSLVVTEDGMPRAGVYCNTKSKWFAIKTVHDPLNIIGFFNNFLVHRYCPNTVLLRNMDTLVLQTLTSSKLADDSVKCINTQGSTFFIHSNNIYSIDVVMGTAEKNIICIINRWDQQRNIWITVLRLKPELLNDILSVSLKVEASNGDDVYLFMTVERSHKPSKNTITFTSCFIWEDPAVTQKLSKIFYVFFINMKDFSYRQIGKRRNEQTDLNVCRKILLRDKIVFLLSPDSDLERKFGFAYLNKKDCFLSCLQLLLDGENCWMSSRLRAPFPDIRDISIRKRGIECLNCSVTTCKNLLFVGVHWSPHVFQVFKYDLSTLIVNSLPSIPLPGIYQVSINALIAYQPVCDFLKKETRFADVLNFHFKDWSLLSWDGTLI